MVAPPENKSNSQSHDLFHTYQTALGKRYGTKKVSSASNMHIPKSTSEPADVRVVVDAFRARPLDQQRHSSHWTS